ncbi:hypothetical protein CJP46_35335 [Paenibacillus sp. XY044]|nr:hypothetical protein CJP46_35335 [Paenibacillus sp. XY044]
MKKYVAFVVSGLILMIAFAFLIYPTPYKYVEYTNGSGFKYPVRVNIITGKTMIFTVKDGWEVIKNSGQ